MFGAVLSQTDLTTTNATNVLSVGPNAANGAMVTMVSITNRTGSAVTYRASITKSGESADATKQYLGRYDGSIAANDYELLPPIGAIARGDALRIKAGTANALSVTVYGAEQP